MLKRIFDSGLVLPIPNPWIKGLAVRFFRWDLDPSDRRIGLTLQIEW